MTLFKKIEVHGGDHFEQLLISTQPCPVAIRLVITERDTDKSSYIDLLIMISIVV